MERKAVGYRPQQPQSVNHDSLSKSGVEIIDDTRGPHDIFIEADERHRMQPPKVIDSILDILLSTLYVTIPRWPKARNPLLFSK